MTTPKTVAERDRERASDAFDNIAGMVALFRKSYQVLNADAAATLQAALDVLRPYVANLERVFDAAGTKPDSPYRLPIR